MLFTSSIFLFMFLPVVLGLYYICPARLKNLLLVCFSVLFYTWGEKFLVIVMLTSTVVDYFAALIIDSGRRKLGMILSLIVNLGFLAFFKYFNFGFENFRAVAGYFGLLSPWMSHVPYITLPIGISFYTFQTLSYTIDVYRGHVKATRNFIDFCAYVTIFPQLIAGPIVRYVDIHQQLNNKDISSSNFAYGIERFVVGFIKKMLIANTCAEVADGVFSSPTGELSSIWAWIGIVMYALQIYFDFSGYSDMAIGLGRMLGFDFLENFNYPYGARSIRDFWRRWHISLSTWFRDYVYIPLGGNKGKASKVYFNLLIVFLLTGLWHGASWNFIIWGLFHGLFLVVERIGFAGILSNLWRPVQHAYTILVVLVGWVFFRADNLGIAINYLATMFSFSGGEPSRMSYLNYFFSNSFYLSIGLIAAVLSVWNLSSFKGVSIWRNIPYFYRATLSFVLALTLFILSIAFVAADTYNPFIYFRF